jgi:pimeloyl-ACP methyl ester carboxylesterase
MMTNNKPPLVLIPGLMCDDAVWTPLLPWLEELSTPHLVDHGDANSLTTMAEQVLKSVEGSFLMAGHSMGGRVAMQVMRLAPERLLGVALMDTGHKPLAEGEKGLEERQKRQVLLDLAKSSGVRAMASEWVKGMVAPSRLSDSELIENILLMFERKSADIFERQIQALLSRPDGAPSLVHASCPVALICGEMDSWSPVSQHEEMSALLSAKPRVQVVLGAGHMCTMESPMAVASEMMKWIEAC